MSARFLLGDCRKTLRLLDSNSVQMCVTSPPYYGLRDYGEEGQIGLESTYPEYIEQLMVVFREVKRVLCENGTLWLNLGDTYATGAGSSHSPGGRPNGHPASQPNRMPQPGVPKKSLIGIPWRVAFALQAEGWIIRSDIIWQKIRPLPESAKNRFSRSHEYLFLLAKSESYWFDSKFDSGSKQTVWTVPRGSIRGGDHSATFPPGLIEPCILAGSKPGDTVLDPFGGTGTTADVAAKHNRNAILCEIKSHYVDDAKYRFSLQNNVIQAQEGTSNATESA